MRLHRLQLFLLAEKDFRLFPMTKAAARLRKRRSSQVEHYMRATAPDKYHNVLVPDYEIGCKRRIFDCGYLASLNEESFILTDTNIERIIPEGIKTDHGVIPADIIILATGFKTNQFLSYMEVIGRGGKSVTQHWDQYGGPGAYNTSVMSGFPNFFMLMGPNSATGHTSALMAVENSVNYALRILKPILQGRVLAVEIKEEAEQTYIHEVQKALAKRVWNAGCASWYINEKKWNSMAYPWSQAHFWWRSLFPTWSDWNLKTAKSPKHNGFWVQIFLLLLLGCALLGALEYQTPRMRKHLGQ
ncbi:hypothetical protein CBS115989_10756 [Aspergillus niger]|nr:hypothetical protein ANI_1_3048014 [Aspergillus niger CBS 513.88]KAI2812131.1 hypothetical protein CBS115989_10756 [Aspergillus niger]KAI2834759.1 hypothetical protein CBS11232_10734 [Aspergillus niger]KAI2868263.1 hypothetical protein CBS115988_10805 [Aspergillus niger]KAI2961715.1 hypothetical protein CBS147322_353 [Aspergillus niger]|eukprot:XP_003188561.1 hypothetical protein ANI_1_3048014 [Aspergillus niger CBS 513.88]